MLRVLLPLSNSLTISPDTLDVRILQQVPKKNHRVLFSNSVSSAGFLIFVALYPAISEQPRAFLSVHRFRTEISGAVLFASAASADARSW